MKIKNPIKEGIAEVKRLINNYIDLLKIKSVKKVAEIGSEISYGLFIFILTVIGLSFCTIALALYIGGLLGSYSLGFLIVGALPFIAVGFLKIYKKKVRGRLRNFFTRAIMKINEK